MSQNKELPEREFPNTHTFVKRQGVVKYNTELIGLPWSRDDAGSRKDAKALVIQKYDIKNEGHPGIQILNPSRGPGRHSLSNGNFPAYVRGVYICLDSVESTAKAEVADTINKGPETKVKPTKSDKKQKYSAGAKGRRGLDNRDRENEKKVRNRKRREDSAEGMIFTRHQPYTSEDDVAD